MRKIVIWFKSAAGIASTCLLILATVLTILGLHSLDDTKSILFGIATNLVGIAVTVSFVQFLFDRQNEKKERVEEKKNLLRHHRVMMIIIRNYIVYYNNVVTPLEERAKQDPRVLKCQFKFSDLRDLYKQSLLLKDRMYKPSITSFYEAERQLRDYCISCINNIEYKYYPQVQKPILSFIDISLQYDTSDAILGNQTITGSNEKLTVMVEKLIADDTNDWIGKFDRDELGSNLMIPYVLLYKMLQKEAVCVIEYIEKVNDILNSPDYNQGKAEER